MCVYVCVFVFRILGGKKKKTEIFKISKMNIEILKNVFVLNVGLTLPEKGFGLKRKYFLTLPEKGFGLKGLICDVFSRDHMTL